MLKIRLKRVGKRNQPQYRIIVIPARTKRDGKAVESIGYLNPLTKEIKLDKERAKYWLSVGAQPTDTVRSILAKNKLTEKMERPKRPPKKPKKELKKEEGEKKPEKKQAKPEKVKTETKKPEKETPKKTEEKKEVKKESKKEEKPKKAPKKEDKK